jgi:hypothetical protein
MDTDTAVQAFLKDVPKARQPFAISWITHVSYVAQEAEESGEAYNEVTARMRQKNIQVLVLSLTMPQPALLSQPAAPGGHSVQCS